MAALLQHTFRRDELTRGEATQVLQGPERKARRIIFDVITGRLLSSEAPAKPVRMGFPIEAVGYYFPRLYLEGVELEFNKGLA